MRRILFVMLMALFTPPGVLAADAGWGDLSSWNNDYPVRERNGHSETLLSHNVRSALKGMLNHDELRRLDRYAVQFRRAVGRKRVRKAISFRQEMRAGQCR